MGMKRPMVAFLTLLATCYPVAAQVGNITSLDLFVVRTISFKLLYGLVIASRPPAASHDQRHYQSDCRVDRWAGD